MLSDFDRKVCQKHKLEILTIDLKQSTADEDKFLCIKCLMEKIDISNMALVEETKIMIKQMKSEQLNNKIKDNQIRIQNFKQIESQVKEMKVSINITIDKLSSNLNQKITQMENQLDDSESKTLVSTFEEDVRILSKFYKGSYNFEISKEFEQSLDDNSYLDSIEEQLQSIINCPRLIEIKECLERTKVENKNKDVKQLKLLNKKEEDPYKTPSLKIQCNKHGKEIIMFNLNPDETEFSRLACLNVFKQIIQSNTLLQEMLTLNGMNIQDKLNQRYLKSSQIIDILQDIKEEHNSTLSEIINKVNTQYSMFFQNEINEFNGNVICQMNFEQINGIAEILSQQDKFQVLSEKQFVIQKKDVNQLELISTKFGKLMQNDLVATQNINKILKESSFIMPNVKDQTKEIVQDDQNSIQNFQQIKQLNLQIEHFKIYQAILNDGLNQYDVIMRAMSSLSNEFKDAQLQQFNEYVSKIQKDFSLIQKFKEFDQITKELKLCKEEKESLQNQLIENDKMNLGNIQKINDLRIHNQEQITKIDDLKDENENLLVKLEEFEQQKIQFEVIIQEQQTQLQTYQEINQQKQEIIQQLQNTLNLQFSQSLTFSTTYKHINSSVTQNGKVIEKSSEDCLNCCMCDQMIPKNGVIQFAFKIIEMQHVMIGIGFRDIVQSKGYQSCYSIGGGTQNIFYNGFCWNHDQQDKNDKQIAFPFSKNDIIIVEVDIQKKYVKWTKQSTNESFSLTIDTSKDLYPCVHLIGTCKVEILNYLFK